VFLVCHQTGEILQVLRNDTYHWIRHILLSLTSYQAERQLSGKPSKWPLLSVAES